MNSRGRKSTVKPHSEIAFVILASIMPSNIEKQCQNTHRSFQQYFFFEHSKDGIVALIKKMLSMANFDGR
jgi:hypothetical protein